MRKILNQIIIQLCVIACSVFTTFYCQTLKEDHVREVEIGEIKQDVIEQEVKDTRFNINWDNLRAQNPDLVAWLYVPDCDISYPVVQTQDNSKYLNTSFKGYIDPLGTPFLDSQASSDFSADNSIIYGHSVSTRGMLTGLKNYEDKAFFDSHPCFYLMTPAASYRIDILCFARVTYDILYYNTSFGDQKDIIVNDLLGQCTWRNPAQTYDSSRQMITISTCDMAYGLGSEHRLLLTGMKTQVDEVRY